MQKKQKVIVALSGGVDSGITAYLLIKQGYDITGVFMRLTSGQEENEQAARAICQYLDIKFYPVNFTRQFKTQVINYFLDTYNQGLTPNPCVVCNQHIKFDELLRLMKEMKGDYLATGHYVKKAKSRHQVAVKYKILKAKDENKDQSYFLYTLTQEQLKYIIFPLGDYTKVKIKKIAAEVKLPHLKQESQDICFLHQNGKAMTQNEFLKKYLKLKPGPIQTLDEKEIGEHQGLPLYTIGQRQGIKIGGTGPFYVVKTDYKNNTLYITNNSSNSSLFGISLVADKVNWISNQEPKLPFPCQAVIRYRHKPIAAIITKKDKNTYLVEFNEPQRAITPGQSVVFYKGEELLGGGIIGFQI